MGFVVYELFEVAKRTTPSKMKSSYPSLQVLHRAVKMPPEAFRHPRGARVMPRTISVSTGLKTTGELYTWATHTDSQALKGGSNGDVKLRCDYVT